MSTCQEVTHGPEEALRRLNESLEKQARRIAQSLHDEAGQLLTAAHLSLAEAARELPPAARERLQDVRGHLDLIEEQLRRLAHELRPRILDDLGLVPALEFLAEGVGRRRGISITVEANVQGRLAPIVETTVYRLAQEALTNVRKHAGASRAVIRLEQEPRHLLCIIRDDGIGFDVRGLAPHARENGLGLSGMQDRVEALGGTLIIDSAPGRGTVKTIAIPLDV